MTSLANRAQRLRALRLVLGLNQEELGWLLGLGERTVVRLEAGEEETGLDDTVHRLLWLVLETRVEDAEAMLRELLLDAPGPAPRDARQAALSTAIARLRSSAPAFGLRLKDARISRWVYWATGERASAAETLALARTEGLICRPIEPRPHYLSHLAPRDRVLLCHDGEPLGWFAIEAQPAVEGLPPVFRFVDASSKLGRRLASLNYGLSGVNGDRRYSCLAVRELDEPLERPAPRGRGIRDTMTAFSRRDG